MPSSSLVSYHSLTTVCQDPVTQRRAAGGGSGRRGRGAPGAVPGNRALEPLVEIDLGLPPERVVGLLDVRDPQLDVGVVERLKDQLARTAGQPLDALREVVDRHGRARVADVESLADGLRTLEAEECGVDHVIDVAPGAN